jgi:hypothetical protein
MLTAALISFALGSVGICVGVLWLQYAAAPGEFWSWELIPRTLSALHLAFLGGLCLTAASCWCLSRAHHRMGYHRCRFCDRPLAGVGKWCKCPESAKLEREYIRASKHTVA